MQRFVDLIGAEVGSYQASPSLHRSREAMLRGRHSRALPEEARVALCHVEVLGDEPLVQPTMAENPVLPVSYPFFESCGGMEQGQSESCCGSE